MKIKPEVQQEIMVRQERVLKASYKLMQGKDRKTMDEFLKSGKAPGSKEFRTLKPNVQRAVVKLNVSGLEVMIKRTKNPFSKLRYMLAKTSADRLLKSDISNKKVKKVKKKDNKKKVEKKSFFKKKK